MSLNEPPWVWNPWWCALQRATYLQRDDVRRENLDDDGFVADAVLVLVAHRSEGRPALDLSGHLPEVIQLETI